MKNILKLNVEELEARIAPGQAGLPNDAGAAGNSGSASPQNQGNAVSNGNQPTPV
jgi:hypothetical protein